MHFYNKTGNTIQIFILKIKKKKRNYFKSVYPGEGGEAPINVASSSPPPYTSEHTPICNNSHRIPAACWQTISNTQNRKRNRHTLGRTKGKKKPGVGVGIGTGLAPLRSG